LSNRDEQSGEEAHSMERDIDGLAYALLARIIISPA
jgi:hypothetical protein